MKLKKCGRPGDRVMRPQHPRRHDGRNRVGGIVHAVDDVESECDRNQGDQQRKDKRTIHDEVRRT